MSSVRRSDVTQIFPNTPQSVESIEWCVRANFPGLKRRLPSGVQLVLIRDTQASRLSVVAHSATTAIKNSRQLVSLSNASIVSQDRKSVV